MEWFEELFEALNSAVFTHSVQPVLFSLGAMQWVEPAFEATGFVLLGAVQLALTALLIAPLEKLRPAEASVSQGARATDRLYAIANRIGVVPLAAFFMLYWLLRPIESTLRMNGFVPWSLEDFIPGLHQIPVLSVVVYLVVIDFAEYWRHRAQHRFEWWWTQHAVHHSQREMSYWTDDRNPVLDEILAALWLAVIALVIGVPPAQFPFVVFIGKFIESLSHANLRLHFGALDRVFVSPHFHRWHHAIGEGHEGPARGCNFGASLAVWDSLFGTRLNSAPQGTYPRTGIRDQLTNRHYGNGFLETQWLALKRLVGEA